MDFLAHIYCNAGILGLRAVYTGSHTENDGLWQCCAVCGGRQCQFVCQKGSIVMPRICVSTSIKLAILYWFALRVVFVAHTGALPEQHPPSQDASPMSHSI